VNYLLRLASNLDPSDLSLPSSWDYSCEHQHPASICKIGIESHQKCIVLDIIFGLCIKIIQRGRKKRSDKTRVAMSR
jgi:hypothetical protein